MLSAPEAAAAAAIAIAILQPLLPCFLSFFCWLLLAAALGNALLK